MTIVDFVVEAVDVEVESFGEVVVVGLEHSIAGVAVTLE
jgi:hypothetical protein